MTRRILRKLADLLFQPPADVMVRAWFYRDYRACRRAFNEWSQS